MRKYVERLQAMTDVELADEWSRIWYVHRTRGTRYQDVQGKLNALRDVIVDRFTRPSRKKPGSDYRIAGYAWALSQAHHALIDDTVMHQEVVRRWPSLEPGSDEFADAEAAFERGVDDANRVVIDGEVLSVAQAADKAGVSKRYVQAEIHAGRLAASKIGNQYVIEAADFAAWQATPRRGSRTK